VLWHFWLDTGCWYHVYKTIYDQSIRFSYISLTLYVERQEGHPAHKNPVVVPESLSIVRAAAYPGYHVLKGRKMVVHFINTKFTLAANVLYHMSVSNSNAFNLFLKVLSRVARLGGLKNGMPPLPSPLPFLPPPLPSLSSANQLRTVKTNG